MSAALTALHLSVTRLRGLVETLGPDTLTNAAYPSEWTIADTLSHLGSGAVIMGEVLERTLVGLPVPDDLMARVWDEWNAKTPADQAAEALAADSAFLDALISVTDEQAASRQISMGDADLDFATFARHRLEEHVLHTWDVAVALDPSAGLPDDVTPAVLDGLGWVTPQAGRPVDDEREIIVHTLNPGRILRLELGPDAVLLEIEDHPNGDLAELHLPAEALIRLVYGRLDVDHTPSGVGGSADLDELRRIFPGL